MSGWIKHKDYTNVYYCSEEFNGYTYVIQIIPEVLSKSIRYWPSLSSGTKRKELDIFEEKPNKSKGGIKALLWAKDAILDFPNWYKYSYGKQQYICIAWADNRRRNIYERLKSEGFKFMKIDGNKILIKKI